MPEIKGFSSFTKSGWVKQVSFLPTSPMAGRLRVTTKAGATYDYDNVHARVAGLVNNEMLHDGSVGKVFNAEIKRVYGSTKV